jgi:2-polyprenyl-6-methoxyphenol hydroxylase-like FAD-dependent oxidoreductase
MEGKRFDVIVVGARCAGAPTAMLLARKGYDVLLVDRATFPSDTVSTHIVHPPGVAALRRWGLLDAVVESGCPAIDTYAFDFGPFALVGAPGTEEEPVAYAPRRTVLDALLVRAAADAGAEVRQGYAADELIVEDDRVRGIRGHDHAGTRADRAEVVVGADGRTSWVARAVDAPEYLEKPPLLVGAYAYWRDLPMDGWFETYVRTERGIAAWPTNDGLTLVIVGWPYAELAANRADVEGTFAGAIELAPAFAERVRAGSRATRFVSTAVPNYFRRPYGPGWALVGDAGYNRDFITGQGIQDAFRDAELCAAALDESLSGGGPFDDAMAAYQRRRDAQVMGMYELTTQIATLEPPPPELQELLASAHGDRAAMDLFARVNAGVSPPAEFFALAVR